jgi:hypothetical protein
MPQQVAEKSRKVGCKGVHAEEGVAALARACVLQQLRWEAIHASRLVISELFEGTDHLLNGDVAVQGVVRVVSGVSQAGGG